MALRLFGILIVIHGWRNITGDFRHPAVIHQPINNTCFSGSSGFAKKASLSS